MLTDCRRHSHVIVSIERLSQSAKQLGPGRIQIRQYSVAGAAHSRLIQKLIAIAAHSRAQGPYHKLETKWYATYSIYDVHICIGSVNQDVNII